MAEANEGLFIGARALTNEQVKLIVPTYDHILDQIKEIRNIAKIERIKESKQSYEKNETYNKKQHNNTIGLFGQRGTGKSSTLYTLISELTNAANKESNIVLPIIEPDNYGENTKILGVILGLLKKEIEKIEEQIKKNNNSNKNFDEFFQECRFKKSNHLALAYNELLEYYCYKEDEYRKLLTQNYSDMETYKKKYGYILSPDYEFSEKLKIFIDKLVEVKNKLNGNAMETLIFIIIDDIDLKTNKCKELVDSVMQYTCHPNVVCILSGDYEILEESVTLALLDGEKITQTTLANSKEVFENGMSLVGRKKYLSKEYLKKILPPAFRHNVVKWTNKNIPQFSFYYNDGSKDVNVYLYDKLRMLFSEYSIFYYRLGKDNNDILEISDSCIPELPYGIFDKTPRGLINVLYYLSKFDKERFDNVEDKEYKFAYVKSLIDTIVDSSNNLVRDKQSFYDEVLMWGASEETSSLNLVELQNRFDDFINKDEINSNEFEQLINQFYIVECVRVLLKNINYKEDSYKEVRYRLAYLLCNKYNIVDGETEKLKGKEKYEQFIQYNDNYKENYRLRNAIIDMVLHTDFTIFNLFFDMAKEKLKLSPTTNITEDIVFNSVSDILLSDKLKGYETLKIWYRESYDTNKNMKWLLEFMDNYSRIEEKNYLIEQVYNELLSRDIKYNVNIDYFIEEIQLMQNPERHKNVSSEKDSFYSYIKPLLINYLHELYTSPLDLKKCDFNSRNQRELYDILTKQRNKEYDLDSTINMNKYIDIKFKLFIDKFVNKLEEIFNSGKYRINYSNVLTDVYEFSLGNGCRGTTVYGRTSRFINNILKIEKVELDSDKYTISINEYIKIVDKLHYLAYRSTAWYGVFEARNLLADFKTKSELRFTNSIEAESRILWAYAKYKKDNDINIKSHDTLNTRKKLILDLLEKAFNSTRESEENVIKMLNLNLDDFE